MRHMGYSVMVLVRDRLRKTLLSITKVLVVLGIDSEVTTTRCTYCLLSIRLARWEEESKLVDCIREGHRVDND